MKFFKSFVVPIIGSIVASALIVASIKSIKATFFTTPDLAERVSELERQFDEHRPFHVTNIAVIGNGSRTVNFEHVATLKVTNQTTTTGAGLTASPEVNLSRFVTNVYQYAFMDGMQAAVNRQRGIAISNGMSTGYWVFGMAARLDASLLRTEGK